MLIRFEVGIHRSGPPEYIGTIGLCSIQFLQKLYFVNKIVLTYCGKNNSSDEEKKNEITRTIIQTVKGQNNFWYRILF